MDRGVDETHPPTTLDSAVDTLHFAYGSNMDARQMSLRCPRSRMIGTALLPGWRFRINAQGWATVVPERGALVHGRIWALSIEDEAHLDAYEDVASGLYTKDWLPVITTDGTTPEVMIYLATDSQPGSPLRRYLEPILHAAADAGFPPGYLQELGRWMPSVSGVE